MYDCESWTIKKAECQRIDAFKFTVLEKNFESPLDSKEIKWVNPKGNNPEYSLAGLMLKLQYFDHLMWRDNSLENILMLGKIEGRRRRGWQRMRWLVGITDLMDMSLSKFQEIVKGREAWHTVIHGVAKSWTWVGDWKTTATIYNIVTLRLEVRWEKWRGGIIKVHDETFWGVACTYYLDYDDGYMNIYIY